MHQSFYLQDKSFNPKAANNFCKLSSGVDFLAHLFIELAKVR